MLRAKIPVTKIKGKNMRIYLLALMAAATLLTGCDRPAKAESVSGGRLIISALTGSRGWTLSAPGRAAAAVAATAYRRNGNRG